MTTKAYVDVQQVVHNAIREIGYVSGEMDFDADNCGTIVLLDEQSTDNTLSWIIYETAKMDN